MMPEGMVLTSGPVLIQNSTSVPSSTSSLASGFCRMTSRIVSSGPSSVLAIGMGVLIRYYHFFDKLVLPTITLLSPVSPIAWLPVAIFLFVLLAHALGWIEPTGIPAGR